MYDNNNAYEQLAESIKENIGFKAYIKKYGYHFNTRLAKIAISMMTADDEDVAPIPYNNAVNELSGVLCGCRNKNSFTIGDFVVVANWAKMHLYPYLLKDDADCYAYALAMADMIDGYEGLPFMHWLSDIVGVQCVEIEWVE